MPKFIEYGGKQYLTAKDVEFILFLLQNATLPYRYFEQANNIEKKFNSLKSIMDKKDDNQVPAIKLSNK